jgi:sterol desaturase/sphingolipid hydroxylase (fatty acid hydroxylase superfamily)
MGKFSDRGTEATDNTDAKDVRASADGASADFPICLVDYINPLTPSWRWKQGAYWLFALFVYHYLWDVAAAHALAPGWVAAVVARNLAVMTIWYGGYHHLLYTKLVSDPQKHKFNTKFPQPEQHQRDAFWTAVGFLINAAIEVGFMHLFATGRIPTLSMTEHPLWFAFWIPVVPMTQDVHFFFAHRLLHFKLVYKWVHYLHHKSYNPGPWSGMAMHPVEQAIYLTRSFLPLVFCLHPVHFLYAKIRAELSPAPGHSGFATHGGSQAHYIHHSRFEWNYGAGPIGTTLDIALGSYKGS